MSRKVSLVLKVVNHNLRQRIIDLLDEKDRMTITDIHSKLRLERSVVLQHLTVLKRVGIVLISSHAGLDQYSLDRNRLTQMSRMMDELVD